MPTDLGNTADRREAAERAVGSMAVVPADVSEQCPRAVPAGRVGEAGGPTPVQRLHEGLRLPVRLRPSRARVAASEAELEAGLAPGARAVTVAVVGEDALDDDSPPAIPSDGPTQEGQALTRPLAREQLRVGKARVVVDRHLQVLPAGRTASLADVVPEHTLAERPEAAELLDVDVQELARALALVALNGATRRSRQPGGAVAREDLPNGGCGDSELGADHKRPCLRLPAGGDGGAGPSPPGGNGTRADSRSHGLLRRPRQRPAGSFPRG